MSRKRRFTLILVLMLLLLSVVGMAKAGWILYTGGPYRGQVLDAETRQPLEGVVVLFHWDHSVFGGPGGPKSRFLKAVEVLTDKGGRFYVPWFVGISPNPFSVVRWGPGLTIFYPGYRPERAEVTPPGGEPVRDPSVVPMRKLRTREERVERVGGLPPGGVPDEAMPNLIRLMNKERTALGLKPVHVLPGSGR